MSYFLALVIGAVASLLARSVRNPCSVDLAYRGIVATVMVGVLSTGEERRALPIFGSNTL